MRSLLAARPSSRSGKRRRRRSAPKQEAEVLAFPADRSVVERKRALPVAETARVVHAAPRSAVAWEELVQHLVEDDELHEVQRDIRTIERGVDPDLSGLMIVHAQPDGLAAPLRGHAPPADAG